MEREPHVSIGKRRAPNSRGNGLTLFPYTTLFRSISRSASSAFFQISGVPRYFSGAFGSWNESRTFRSGKGALRTRGETASHSFPTRRSSDLFLVAHLLRSSRSPACRDISPALSGHGTRAALSDLKVRL